MWETLRGVYAWDASRSCVLFSVLTVARYFCGIRLCVPQGSDLNYRLWRQFHQIHERAVFNPVQMFFLIPSKDNFCHLSAKKIIFPCCLLISFLCPFQNSEGGCLWLGQRWQVFFSKHPTSLRYYCSIARIFSGETPSVSRRTLCAIEVLLFTFDFSLH